jgi:hypothetical protein
MTIGPLLAPCPERFAEAAFQRYPWLGPACVERANAACVHQFDLLGSGPVNLGPKIDWHVDFKTGRQWDQRRRYRRAVEYIDPDGGDVIVPWELSRFQHASALGLAWLYTGDRRYPQEFVAQVSSWLDSNRPPLGVNWACTMDVAIRAVNWLWGLELMAGSLPADFRRRILEALFRHAQHIQRNPEVWGGLRNNHYLADVCGLTVLGALFRDSGRGRSWLTAGARALEAEVVQQTYPDGTNFEGSTNYHRLSTELFLLPAVVLERIGTRVSAEYRQRLAGMARFVAAYTRPDGSWPQIGDTDDGRLQIFDPGSMGDHRYLIAAIAAFLGDPALKALRPVLDAEAFLILSEPTSSFDRLPAAPATQTTEFPDSGYYLMGDADRGDWALVRCGPVGVPGTGGHAHCDSLAVELAVGGRPLLVDRGTGVYTSSPEVRNRYRSTHMHNTVRVDGAEQNAFDPNRLWYMPDCTQAACLEATPTRFDGQHQGYARLDSAVVHRRRIAYQPGSRSWEIIDQISGVGRHRIEAFWHFDPTRRVAVDGHCVVTDAGRLELYGPRGLMIRLAATTHSAGYGKECAAEYVVAETDADLPVTLQARVYP